MPTYKFTVVQHIVRHETGGQPKIKLFDNRNYTGMCREIEGDMPTLRDFKDKTSSVEVVCGTWLLYTGNNYKGKTALLTEGVKCNLSQFMNDDINSLKPITAEYVSEPKCVIYNSVNFDEGGGSQTVTSDCSHLEDLGCMKTLSSIDVKAGVLVAWSGVDYMGDMWVFPKGQWSGHAGCGKRFDNKISSLKFAEKGHVYAASAEQ